MQRVIVLHTNDIHGRVDGLARIATLVAETREANAGTPVLRGQQRGLFHLGEASVANGALLVGGEVVDPEREYWVAGSDWEFETYGGYVPKEWGLQPQYDVPTIMREALEEYLAGRPPVAVRMGRLAS